MEENTQKFVIDAQLFGAVGTLWAGTPSSISPFRHGKVQTPGNDEKKALAVAGICDANGQILSKARPALDVLGNANAFTRIYLSGNQIPTECIVYFAPNSVPVSLQNIRGEMQVTLPADAKLFIAMVAEGIGLSLYRSVPFDATLTHDEAVALAAMIDLQRKQALKSVAEEQPPIIVDCDVTALWRTTSKKGDNTQWLSNVLLDILSLDGIPTEDRLKAALESLATKGYIQKNSSSYRLSGTPLDLARRMLIFDTALTLTSGYLGKNGLLNISGFTCLQAGIHDLLIIDASVDSVNFQSVSSSGVLDNIQVYLTDVHMLEKLDTPGAATTSQPSVAAASNKKFCGKCGTVIQPGKKFCPHCGEKIN